ncbi:uncharacterized protein LOC109712073 [Ananas comosus]|uniref:Uncharacterized protein LOC109712073 n=1 Tax=Ananas comosus TaxID=4615 RepID=A0A6P5F527_ANACO|nr:uncharacterized protein LOC109712073 [Ananas comosus]
MPPPCAEPQEPHRAMFFRVPSRAARPRRRRMAVARLGGRRRRGGGGVVGRLRLLLLGVLRRRLRLRWLAVQYRRAVRRLREHYAAAMRALIAEAAALEAPTAKAPTSQIMPYSCFAAAPLIPACHSYYYIR